MSRVNTGCVTTVIRSIYGLGRGLAVEVRLQMVKYGAGVWRELGESSKQKVRATRSELYRLLAKSPRWSKVHSSKAATIGAFLHIGWQPIAADTWISSGADRWTFVEAMNTMSYFYKEFRDSV